MAGSLEAAGWPAAADSQVVADLPEGVAEGSPEGVADLPAEAEVDWLVVAGSREAEVDLPEVAVAMLCPTGQSPLCKPYLDPRSARVCRLFCHQSYQTVPGSG